MEPAGCTSTSEHALAPLVKPIGLLLLDDFGNAVHVLISEGVVVSCAASAQAANVGEQLVGLRVVAASGPTAPVGRLWNPLELGLRTAHKHEPLMPQVVD